MGAEISPRKVVELIRANVLRIRTGLWLLPNSCVGQERNEAARLMVDAVDISELLIQHLPATSRFSGLNEQRLIELLDEISDLGGHSNCVLVYNFDLLLARLSPQAINNVWQYLFEFMPHRPRALLLTLPAQAIGLLPSEDQLKFLARDQRLSTIIL